MPTVRRLLAALCALALLAGTVAPAAIGASSDSPGTATPSKKKGKRCKKGFKPKTVTKKGKKTKVCRKAKQPAPKPGPQPGPRGIFDAPGQKLEGEAAKPFLEKYLLNSTFTDCPTGWPTCGGFEDRYSHTADSTFYKCWLRPTSGSDVKSVGEYRVDNARVEPDGSWIFNETVYWYGNFATFEWQVAANGVVNGAYQSASSGEPPEKIGPLQYVSGARDCSY
ncbi:MAG TPA: hypothetical protein VN752_09820 [Solirubrobacterales bacterium]|nr:hypothetical protein [Solirubrobacterales bacterium]